MPVASVDCFCKISFATVSFHDQYPMSILMKNNLIFAVCLLVIQSCSNIKTGPFSISGSTLDESLIGKTVVLTIYDKDGGIRMDSTVVEGNKTFSFNGKVDDVCLAMLTVRQGCENGRDSEFHFFIEGGDIEVSLDPVLYYSMEMLALDVRGSKSDAQYRKETKNCYVELSSVSSSEEDLAISCLKKHSDAFYAPYLYYVTLYSSDDYVDFMKQMNAFSGDALNSYHYHLLSQMMSTKQALANGAIIPNFTLPDMNGNEVDIVDFAKGKKLVLVDFWASWCGSCREEMKNLKPIYEKYKAEGFDVIGVSIDHDENAWRKAVEKDSLTWTNVCECVKPAEAEVVKMFEIQGVPLTILIDGEGKILAKKLYGELLHQTIAQQMQQ